MGKKQLFPISLSDIELDPVITISIEVMIALGGATPPAAIFDSPLRLSRPTAVIHGGGDRMSGRCDREQINDHRFIPSDQGVMQVKAIIGRPVPVQKIA